MSTSHRLRGMRRKPEAAGTLTQTAEGRLVGLDGLRALAVMSVMAFHFGAGWLSGGFLGVDVFYVLSGFLITSLLVNEYGRLGRLRLQSFWARRARRLLPCLVLVLIAVTLYVWKVAPAGSYPGYRWDALSALFYFSNWHQIAANSNYFAATGPTSLLAHTWSLSIEEQFYLVWPVVVLGLMWMGGNVRRGVRGLLVLSAVGAVASALEMGLLYNPAANTTRLYFGTDTHAQSLLVGAALACCLMMVAAPRAARAARGGAGTDPREEAAGSATGGPTRGSDAVAPSSLRMPVVRSAPGRAFLVATGLAGLGGVVVLSHVLGNDPAATYRGGFLLTDVCCAAVIVGAVCVPGAVLARMLSVRPLAWLGTISYGLYLWHFPLGFLLSPARTGLNGAGLFWVRSVVTVAVATASYYLVERPVMRGEFWRSLRALAPAAVVTGGSVALLLVVTEGATVAPAAAHFGAGTTAASLARQPVSTASADAWHTTTPAHVVVLGDSTALTLGDALVATAPHDTQVTNNGLYGCGLAIATAASGAPPGPGLPMTAACNSASPPALQWPDRDRSAVADAGPGDVVIFLAGHWETQGILRKGRWTNLLSSSFREYERHQLQLLVQIATAHGAHLELFTMPCMDGNFASGAPPGPTDSNSRRTVYNDLLYQIAAQYPKLVNVVPFGSLVCPTGRFTEFLGGVQVRSPDGVHTPSYSPGNIFAGNATEPVAERFYSWLSPRLWPMILFPPPTR